MAVTILVLITLASNVLSIINSPVFQKAYKEFRSTEKARDELDKLKVTIETIQAVLVDAEKKQQGSDAVKKWIDRVTNVLYDAEDLFEEVAFNDLLEGAEVHKKRGKPFIHKLKLVSRNCSIGRNYSIAKEVKAIRKRFLEISRDMEGFKFEVCLNRDEPIWDMRKGQDAGSLIYQDEVFGRDQDKETIVNALLEDSKPSEKVSVIAIVGIGGMGKTTLAQLVYNDEEVKKRFENTWFACISDISDDEEVLGKIFQSMSGNKDSNLTANQLQTKIKEKVEGSNFLLVLDDVWDDDHPRWQHRMRLLSSGTKGGKVIVTTRYSSVAKAMNAVRIHELQGLSENASWDLFKRVAFAPKDENDPRRIDLGRQIVKKCANVPLAIRSIGSLLYKKNSIREWESFKDQELSKLDQQDGSIMNTLKLSYNHLPRKLKHCFAYCSLFPKDFVLESNKLIYLWIAHGYIEPEEGHSYFMELLRMSFFQQAMYYSYGALQSCKMHDLVHDLAKEVAGEEIAMLATPSDQFSKSARHVGVGWKMDDPWEILAPRLDNNRLRSFVLMTGVSHLLSSALDQQFTNFKRLRALSLWNLNIDNVSSSIGELKHLRYLDLSHNKFSCLPDSMMNMLNLISLDMEGCYNLKVLPDNFGNLVNLRCLNILGCNLLKHMPPGFGKLISLQYLSNFNVGMATEGVQRSGLDALSGLELRGMLMIQFDRDIVEWDGDECWQLPVSPEKLWIMMYPGMRIPHWANGKANQLTHLELKYCLRVKNLPPLRCLPYLKSLILDGLFELEYIEDEDEERRSSVALFFQCLEQLEMTKLPKLKGWLAPRLTTASASFPRLSQLKIEDCPELKSMPLSPCVRKLELNDADGEVIQQLLSFSPSLETLSIFNGVGLTSFQDVSLTSLRHISIDRCCRLEALHLAAPHLTTVLIKECDRLKSFRVTALTSLRSLQIYYCKRLMISHIAHPNILEELDVSGCPKLTMLEEDSTGVNWHSLRNLRKLTVDKRLPTEMLPRSLRHLQAVGQLQIIEREIYLGSDSDSDDENPPIQAPSSEQEA